MLAPAAPVAGGRRVGRAARCRPGPPGPARSAGLVPGQRRLRQRPRERRGALTGPNPTDRAKLGWGYLPPAGEKYHLLVTADGLPLNVVLSGANRHDSLFLAPLLDGQRGIKGTGRGRPRRRPVKLHAALPRFAWEVPPGLRQPPGPRLPAPAGHRRAHRPHRRGLQPAPEPFPRKREVPPPLGGRAHDQLAAELQAPGAALRHQFLHDHRVGPPGGDADLRSTATRQELMQRLINPALTG